MAVFARRQSTVAVITKLPYYRGGRKAGFHCNVFQQSRFFSFILNSMFLPFKHRRIQVCINLNHAAQFLAIFIYPPAPCFFMY